jgi:hypothetical protein
VLLRWVLVALGAQDVEGPGQSSAEHARGDHLVDEAELGRLVGVGEFRLVILDEACAGVGRDGRALDLPRCTMPTAPSGPMTAISAVGKARL